MGAGRDDQLREYEAGLAVLLRGLALTCPDAAERTADQ